MKSLLQVRRSSSTVMVVHIIIVAFMTLLVPVAAHASPETGTIGAGRFLPTVAAMLGLIGIVIGRRALARSRRSDSWRTGANLAAALGMVSLLIGALHAANSAGSFGTGNGLAGAIAAIALGVTSMILGGLALNRYRRNHEDGNTAAVPPAYENKQDGLA